MLDSIWTDIEVRERAVTKREETLNQIIKDKEEQLCADINRREAALNSTITKNTHEFGKSQTPKILLNVGGTVFTTTKETLMAEPDSFFSGMVSSGVWQPDPQTGEFFIDRDPQFFKEILNYLREGKLDGKLPGLLTNTSPSCMPVVEKSLTDSDKCLLAAQLDFLQIDSLIKPPQASPGQATGTQFVAFAPFASSGGKPHEKQEALMNQAATSCGGKRAATLAEFQDGLLDGVQDWPKSADYLLGVGSRERYIVFPKKCKDMSTWFGVSIKDAKVQGSAAKVSPVPLTHGLRTYYCLAVG
eukprot:TRINITY_DN67533_c6_g1_i1.p1 TRINITY_DN67533_c6_g1~~TRINITY_DN67533_c6_g1_i1.p1  ORF type:complete len:301 (+),score=48.16 TRINITY_DN67533_c6_g1_i1:63-965(+)